jgi:8-oxo-dGTP pyrophosphatase MutT (NUDIX family)
MVDGGHELVHPRCRWTFVDEDVEATLLLDLHPWWKRLQPAEARTPLTSDEQPITTSWCLLQCVSVAFRRMARLGLSGQPNGRRVGHATIFLRFGTHVQHQNLQPTAPTPNTSSTSVRSVAMSPFIRRLRDRVGNELLVLPSVAVLPRDDRGRVLLVQLVDSGHWATIGGAVEPDEPPQEAARRETQEEAGIEVELGTVRAVLGGPEYRVTYPNGDQTSYVVTVYDARIVDGTPTPDGDETSAVEWWDTSGLPYDEMNTLTRALLRDVGISEDLIPD